MKSVRPAGPLFFAGVLSLLGGAPVQTHADVPSVLKKFLQKDVDVIAVTDLTADGKRYAVATPQKPVRYQILNLGETDFGSSWANEKIPANRTVLKWMMAALRREGYLLADATHPPEQTLVFAWGMLSGKPDGRQATNLDELVTGGYAAPGSSRRALRFLGGDKVNLMWELEQRGGFIDPKVLLRGMIRTGVAGKVWDFAESDLFLGVVRSYPANLFENPNAPMLWETRFACPATGLRMDEAMPLLITAASVNFGRETAKPVSINATRTYGGKVDLGELKVIGADDTNPVPSSAESPAIELPTK